VRETPLVQPLRVPDDVLVVFEQQLCWQLRQIEELRRQCMVKVVDVVLIETFQASRGAGARPVPRSA
jgi:hypothetical protein